MCVLWNCLVGQESITEGQCRFSCELNQQEAPPPNAICWWVREWCEEGSVTCKKPPGWLSLVLTPEDIVWVLASVILQSDLKFHSYKLWIVHSLSGQDKRYAYNFVISFREYWLKSQTCQTTFLWMARHIFICLAQLISRTFDIGQLRTLTNFTSTPLMMQRYHFVCCLLSRSLWTLLLWGWRSLSHQSHCRVTQRW
jgi:hypothetical protein